MSNPYQIAINLTLGNRIGPDLRNVLRMMEGIETVEKRINQGFASWHSPLQRVYSQIGSIQREMRNLRGKDVESSLGNWGKHIGASVKETTAFGGQIRTLKGDIHAITRDLSGWASNINRAMQNVRRVERAAGGVGGGSGGGIRNRGTRHHGFSERGPIGREGSALATSAGVGGGVYSLEQIITQGSSQVREGLRAKNAGLTADEQSKLREEASRLSRLYPSLGRLGIQEQARLLIPNVGDFETAMRVLPAYLKGQVALQTMAGPDEGQKDMEAFARYVDIIGRSMSESDTTALVEGYVRARQLDPEAVKSIDFVNMAKSAAATGKALDVGFWTKVAPGLISQQGGARSGTDVASAYQNTVVARGSQEAIMEQIRSGLRVGGEIGRTKKGKEKLVKSGSLVGAELYNNNPYEWGKKYLVPEMVKQGLLPEGYAKGDYSQDLTDEQRAGGVAYLSKRFSNRRGANIFSMMIQDMDQMEKMMKRLGMTRGLQDILKDQFLDPFVALEAAKKQAAGAASALSEPSIRDLTANLTRLSGAIGATADFFEANKGAAQGTFAVGAGAVGGLATAGAVALTVAAVSALTLPALAIGSIAALTIGSFLFPWEALWKHMGWKQGVALGGDPGEIRNAEAVGALPGVEGVGPSSRAQRRAAAIQGLGVSAENVTEALKRQAELTGRVGEVATPTASALEKLGGAIKSVLDAVGNSSIHGINFDGGSGGASGIGAMIHKASLGGANDNGIRSALGASGAVGAGGPMPAISSSIQMSDAERNTLGLIQKYESHGQNTMNYMGRQQGLSPSHARGYTAQGYFQMLNSNWRKIAPKLGITAPNAMAGTHEEQTRVALWLLRNGGIQNWSNYNPALRGALRRGERAPTGSSSPTPTAPPPPRVPFIIQAHLTTNLDGRKVAHSVSQHQAEGMRFPKKAGGMDTHGSMRSPGTPVTDAA